MPDEEKVSKKILQRFEKRLFSRKREVILETLDEIANYDDKKINKLLLSFLEFISIGERRDGEILSKTISIIGNQGNKNAVNALVPFLEDEDPYVRETTAYALGRIGARKAIPYLINALDDEVFSVRENAANALAKIGDHAAVDALVSHARSPDPETRMSVIAALAAFGDDERCIQALIEAMQDENSQIRFPAIIAFNKIKHPGAIEPLIANLESDDPLLQKVAADALVFNLGWGSIKDGKLTKFGEKRRRLLTGQLASGPETMEKGEQGAIEPPNKISSFTDIADDLLRFIQVSPNVEKKIREYFNKLEEKYNIYYKNK